MEAGSNLADLVSEFEQYQDCPNGWNYQQVEEMVWRCHRSQESITIQEIVDATVQIPEKLEGLFPLNIQLKVNQIERQWTSYYLNRLPTDILCEILKYTEGPKKEDIPSD